MIKQSKNPQIQDQKQLQLILKFSNNKEFNPPINQTPFPIIRDNQKNIFQMKKKKKSKLKMNNLMNKMMKMMLKNIKMIMMMMIMMMKMVKLLLIKSIFDVGNKDKKIQMYFQTNCDSFTFCFEYIINIYSETFPSQI